MKSPPDLHDNIGRVGRGSVVLVTGYGLETRELQEFGTITEGNTSTCSVLVAPDMNLYPRWSINAEIAEFVDVVVDGVLRGSVLNHSIHTLFQNSLDKVLYQPLDSKSKVGKLGGVKNCQMQVTIRDASKGMCYILI